MLAAVRGLGYDGIELGPPGYLGDGPDAVARTLAPYGLELAGAFAPLRIADADGFRDDLGFLDRTVEILAGTGARGPLVIAADENDVRLAAAGRPDALRETALPPDELRRAAERVELAAHRAARPRRPRDVPPAHGYLDREPRGSRGDARRHRSGGREALPRHRPRRRRRRRPRRARADGERQDRSPAPKGRRPGRSGARALAGADRGAGVGAGALLPVRRRRRRLRRRARSARTATRAGRSSNRIASRCGSRTSRPCARSRSATSRRSIGAGRSSS